MIWESYINGFSSFLKLEKSLSKNTIEAYIRDIDKFVQYLELLQKDIPPEKIVLSDLQDFIRSINQLGLSASSQARIISGIKAFYKYLLLEDMIKKNPAELLDAPKLGRKLPDTLSPDEIIRIIGAIDLSKPEGIRNKAILETMYSCGLRVSEAGGSKNYQSLF